MKAVFFNISFLLLLLLGFQKANGQEIKSLALEYTSVSVKSDIVILLSVTPYEPNWCGIRIEWGDGEGQDFRVESRIELIRLTKRYVRPGDYMISVKGKILQRGLKTAPACKGGNLTSRIKVLELETPLCQNGCIESLF